MSVSALPAVPISGGVAYNPLTNQTWSAQQTEYAVVTNGTPDVLVVQTYNGSKTLAGYCADVFPTDGLNITITGPGTGVLGTCQVTLYDHEEDLPVGYPTGTGNMIINGSVLITGPVSVTGTVGISGPVTVTGDVGITGDVTVTGDVGITGPVTVSGDVGITGPVEISGTTTVTGEVLMTNAEIVTTCQTKLPAPTGEVRWCILSQTSDPCTIVPAPPLGQGVRVWRTEVIPQIAAASGYIESSDSSVFLGASGLGIPHDAQWVNGQGLGRVSILGHGASALNPVSFAAHVDYYADPSSVSKIVVWDSGGNLSVLSMSGAVLWTVAYAATGGIYSGLAASPNGDMIAVVNHDNSTLNLLNAADGSNVGTYTAASTTFEDPVWVGTSTVAVNGAGANTYTLLTASIAGGLVKTAIVTYALDGVGGFTAYGDGKVVNATGNAVLAVDSTSLAKVWGASLEVQGPFMPACDDSGNTWVCGAGTSTAALLGLDSGGATIATYSDASVHQLQSGVVVGSSWVGGSSGSGWVGSIDLSTGTYTTLSADVVQQTTAVTDGVRAFLAGVGKVVVVDGSTVSYIPVPGAHNPIGIGLVA